MAGSGPSSLALPSQDRLAGLLLGTAVGDAIGLPYEGLSPGRIGRLLGRRPLGHRLFFGRGLTSDDTEHACLVAQSLLECPDDPEAFGRALARRLRWWLAAAPAGIGWATLRATIRLWCGVSPAHSGVRSAGNGAAMRAPLLGACVCDPQRLADFVRVSSRLTHADPRAEQGALAIALAAREAVCVGAGARIDPSQVFDRILAHVNEPELCRALELAAACLGRGAAPGELLTALGSRRGVSGYVVHTVPVAIFLWLRHAADFRAGVESAVRLGGDTDTVAALVGALAGASQGPSGIPSDWLRGLCEWPRTIAWLERLAARLARRFGEPLSAEPSLGPEPLYWPALVPRSALFAGIVLAHGFRRLLPPY